MNSPPISFYVFITKKYLKCNNIRTTTTTKIFEWSDCSILFAFKTSLKVSLLLLLRVIILARRRRIVAYDRLGVVAIRRVGVSGARLARVFVGGGGVVSVNWKACRRLLLLLMSTVRMSGVGTVKIAGRCLRRVVERTIVSAGRAGSRGCLRFVVFYLTMSLTQKLLLLVVDLDDSFQTNECYAALLF